jgi:hypothetical protein
MKMNMSSLTAGASKPEAGEAMTQQKQQSSSRSLDSKLKSGIRSTVLAQI